MDNLYLCIFLQILPLVSFGFLSRMTINEVGLSDTALDALAQCFSRKPCEIKVCICSSYGTIALVLVCSLLNKVLLLFSGKTGHSENSGPAVSHLFCAGFTEI